MSVEMFEAGKKNRKKPRRCIPGTVKEKISAPITCTEGVAMGGGVV